MGKWHLVHMMAEGLEKLVDSRTTNQTIETHPTTVPETNQAGLSFQHQPHMASLPPANGFYESDPLNHNGFDDEFGLGTSSFLSIQPGELDFNFPGFGL